MCRKLIYLVSFVLVLALAGTNVAFGQVGGGCRLRQQRPGVYG